QRAIVLIDNGWVLVPLIPHVIRIDADAVSAADDCSCSQAVGSAKTGAQVLLICSCAGILRDASKTANQDVMRRGVVPDRAIVIMRVNRIIFPAQAIVDRQVSGDLPGIA